MMNVLVFNAGSASLKFEVIGARSENDALKEQRKLVSGSVEGIGEKATLSLFEGKQVVRREEIAAADYAEATRRVLAWLKTSGWPSTAANHELHAVGHRIVH